MPELITSILGALPYGILLLGRQGEVLLCNDWVLNSLGLTAGPAEVAQHSLSDLLDKLPALQEALEKNVQSAERPGFDLTAVPCQGRYLTIRGRSIAEGTLITFRDVTEAKEKERTNLNTMLEGQEMERKRLARELHDGIGPLISTIKLHLDALRSELRDVPQKVGKKMEVMDELIREAGLELRRVSHDLMPSALEDLGLVAALENLCHKANQSEKVQVEFYHVGMKERLNPKMALGIFRMAQELLNNAFKYAQATIISVQLIRYPESVLLMVEDDGIGFDKADLKMLVQNGIGIRNIQTRARALGGQFHIDAQKDKGVLATIEIPLNV